MAVCGLRLSLVYASLKYSVEEDHLCLLISSLVTIC